MLGTKRTRTPSRRAQESVPIVMVSTRSKKAAATPSKPRKIARVVESDRDSSSDSDESSDGSDAFDSGDDSSDDEVTFETPKKRRAPRMTEVASSGRSTRSKQSGKRSAPVTPTKRAPSQRTQSWRAKRVSAECQSSVIPQAFKSSPEFRKMTPLQKAKAVLHVSATPEFLPRREKEREQIMQLVGSSIMEGGGTCLYIHGVPGTGKTATVHSVIRELQRDGEMDDFQFIEINGMKISEPTSAFAVLWQAISGVKVGARQALANLEQHFNTRQDDRKTIVLLVDELDQMITKKQDVVYNFFNWPHLTYARLTVVAIANTMDLPERELSGKIRSRLGSSRVAFGSYKEADLKAVLQSRLEGIDVFEPVALDNIARRVANVTGDARRALDIARRAVETREQEALAGTVEKDKKIGMREVTDAYKAMMAFTSSPFIRHASLHHQIFLLALSQCVRRYGVSDIPLEEIMVWHYDFIKQTVVVDVPPSHDDIFSIVAQLAAQRLVVAEGSRNDYLQRVRPAIDPVELFNVLSSVEELKRHVPRLATV